MTALRVLVVDDEPPARARLRRLLAETPDVEVVGEAASGAEAVDAVRRLRPDLLLLDVQMPGLDGFGVLAALGAGAPATIFVTAYDQHAVRAFEVHALDYLLKPVEPERLAAALDRARERTRREDAASLEARLRALLAEVRPAPAPAPAAAPAPAPRLERLLVQQGERSVLLELAEVDWIEAAGNYVRLHRGRERFELRGTLAELEARLEPSRFVRIHRSRIVNLHRVRELHPWSHGDMLVVLRDGTELMLSRRYRDRLPELGR